MWPSPQPRADPPSALAATRFPAGSLPRPPTVTEEAEQANKLRSEERDDPRAVPATTMGGTLQRAWRPGVKESLPLGAQTQRWSPDRPGEAQDASSASRRWRKG